MNLLTASPQEGNLLLLLPAEVRNRIYELVLLGKTYIFKDAVKARQARVNTLGDRHIFGLLYTCRQIYWEASLLPYEKNTFFFRDFNNSFQRFFKLRSPAQIRSIRSIELFTYQARQMWAEPKPFSEKYTDEMRVLERMPNLQRLRITVDVSRSLFVDPYNTADELRFPPFSLPFKSVIDLASIEKEQEALARALHDHLPGVIVQFWWV